MKTLAKLMSKAAVIISIDGTLQLGALLAYLNLCLNPTPENMKILIKYGVPTVFGLLALFAVVIPLMGSWLLKFLFRYERGESFSDEELVEFQKRLIDFPWVVGILGCLFWVVTLPVALGILSPLLGWNTGQMVLGAVGGIVGGMISVPFSVYGTSIVTYSLMDLTYEMSPTVPRGGNLGFNAPLSMKISGSFVIMLFGIIVYMGFAGYARLMLYKTDVVYGGLLLNFLILSLSALALTITLAILAARDITSMLERLKSTTFMLSKGELAERAHVITNDEVGELAGVVNTMGEKLLKNRAVIDQIRNELDKYAEELLAVTRKILGIVQEHGAGATQQTASIKQVATTHDMILENARQVAESAEESDKMATNVLEATKEGIRRSNQTVEGIEMLDGQVSRIASAMEDVESKIDGVVEALRVIDEIAERTNLLSLNAALEAAGAGETGRRFTVVAEQIGRLAARSRGASKKIRNLVEEINGATEQAVTMTQEGKESVAKDVKLVYDIQAGLDNINAIATSSSDMARKIDMAGNQQRSSLQQASITIKDLVETTEGLLRGTKETESELEGLEKLAEKIRTTIARKTIDDENQNTAEN